MTNEERAVVAVNAAATTLSGRDDSRGLLNRSVVGLAETIYDWLLKKENGG